MSPARWLFGATSDSVLRDPTVDDENEMQPMEAYRDRAFSSLERDPYKDDGGES
jgi:hypothetical protein